MTACGHIRKNRGLSRSPSVHMCCIAALACPLAHSDVVGPAPLSECLVFPKRAWGQRGQLAPCRAIDEHKEHGEGLKRLIHTKRRDKISGDTGGYQHYPRTAVRFRDGCAWQWAIGRCLSRSLVVLICAMRKALERLGLVADSHLGVYVGKVLLCRIDADGKRFGNLVA